MRLLDKTIPAKDINSGIVRVVLVMSMSHYTKEDERAMKMAFGWHGKMGPKGFPIRGLDGGWQVEIPKTKLDDFTTMLAAASRYGFSQAILKTIREAWLSGYTHIAYEQEGPVHAQFPTYQW